MWRRALWGSVLLYSWGTAGAHQIAPGIAEETVHQFVELFDLSVLFKSNRLVPYHTHAVDSDDPIEALHQLLDGSGLTFRFLNPRVISVDPVEPAMPPVHSARAVLSRPRVSSLAQPLRSVCLCGQSLTPHGWINGPWCQHEDGRAEYVPDRCPLPDPYPH